MEIFDSKKRLVFDTNKHEIYLRGTCADIYKDNGRCIKVFNEPKFSIEPFVTLKQLNLPSFYQIIDYLYNSNNDFIGYITLFYPQDDFNILLDRKYLLREINNVYNGIMAFNNKGYLVADLHQGNVIINKNGLIVIDIDYFIKNIGHDNIILNNLRVKYLIKNLIIKYLFQFYITDVNKAYDLVKQLIDIEIMGIDDFNRIMGEFDKPIDYFRKVIK